MLSAMKPPGTNSRRWVRWGVILLLSVACGWLIGGFIGRRTALEKWRGSYDLARDYSGDAVSSAQAAGPTLNEAAHEYTTSYEGLRDSTVLTAMGRLWTTNAACRAFF